MILLYSIIYFSILYTGHTHFPGLHGDEAYFGSKALELLHEPIWVTPVNSMNNFTSGIFARIIAWVSIFIQNPISQIRLPSIVLNSISFFLILNHYKKNLKIIALIFLSSSFFFIHLKIGIEVVALIPLLYILFFLQFKKQNYSFTEPYSNSFPIILISLCGVIIHPIFGTAVGALLFYFFIKKDVKNLVIAVLINLLPLLTIIYKNKISFLNNKNFLGIILISAVSWSFLINTISKNLETIKIKFHPLEKAKKIIFFGLFIYFLAAHLFPFIETTIGINTLKRYLGLNISIFQSSIVVIPLMLIILSFFKKNKNIFNESNIGIWTFSTLVMFSIINNRPVIRHYIIPALTIVFFIAERAKITKIKIKILNILIAIVITLHSYLLFKKNYQFESKNTMYRIYRKFDTSAHYSKMDKLIHYLNNPQISYGKIVSNQFIIRPLKYFSQIGVLKKKNGPPIYIDYCYQENCTIEGFYLHRERPKDFAALMSSKERYKLENKVYR